MITKFSFINAVRVFAQFHLIEILGTASAMVSSHKINNLLRNTVFATDFDAINNVTYNNLRTFSIRNIVVRIIFTILILNKIVWISCLSDIVIHCACADKKRVATYIIYNFFTKIGHLHHMLESARSLRRQLTKKRTVGIAQLKQRKIGYEAKNAFKKERKRQRKHSKKGISAANQQISPIERVEIAIINQQHSKINDHIGDEHCQGSAEITRSA